MRSESQSFAPGNYFCKDSPFRSVCKPFSRKLHSLSLFSTSFSLLFVSDSYPKSLQYYYYLLFDKPFGVNQISFSSRVFKLLFFEATYSRVKKQKPHTEATPYLLLAIFYMDSPPVTLQTHTLINGLRSGFLN